MTDPYRLDREGQYEGDIRAASPSLDGSEKSGQIVRQDTRTQHNLPVEPVVLALVFLLSLLERSTLIISNALIW